MKDFKNYNFEDFIFDNSFCNFAKGLNEENIILWEEWLSQNYENKKIAIEAKFCIEYLSFRKENLPVKFINNEWYRLISRLKINKNKIIGLKKPKKRIKIWQYAAAVIVFITIIGGFILKNNLFISKKILAETEIVVPRTNKKYIIAR